MRHKNYCFGRISVSRWRWEGQPGPRRLQTLSQDEGSKTHWYSDCCSPAWMGGVVWRKSRNSVRKGQLSEDFKVLQRRLSFILKTTGKSCGRHPHLYDLTFSNEYLDLIHCVIGSFWANEQHKQGSVLSCIWLSGAGWIQAEDIWKQRLARV